LGDLKMSKKSFAFKLMPMPNITKPSKKNKLGLSGVKRVGAR